MRLDSVFMASVCTAFVLFMIVSCCGYATFGSELQPDILKMYPQNTLTSLCRIMFSFIVICHFPLQFNPARKSVQSILTAVFRENERKSNSNGNSEKFSTTIGDTTVNGILKQGELQEEEDVDRRERTTEKSIQLVGEDEGAVAGEGGQLRYSIVTMRNNLC